MPNRMVIEVERAELVRQQQYRVISRKQALASGMARTTLDRAVGPDGRWQRLLPGVYLTVTGTPTRDQLDMAALLYAGSGSKITGTAALRRHGIVAPGPDVVDVLVPWGRRRQSTGYVRIHRTRRMPPRFMALRAIRYVKPARAVADAARMLTRCGDVRDVVCRAIQRRKCTIADLIEELNAGSQAWKTSFREALAEVSDGIRSVAEGDLRVLIKGSDLPEPMYNARLYDSRGRFIAMVDAWWQRAGVAAEVDSRAYHFEAKDQDATGMRHNRLTAKHGIQVVHYPPTAIHTRGQMIIDEIRDAIEIGLSRPPLPISASPASA
jgi:hypothetical protein